MLRRATLADLEGVVEAALPCSENLTTKMFLPFLFGAATPFLMAKFSYETLQPLSKCLDVPFVASSPL